jgi:hypothetical protein
MSRSFYQISNLFYVRARTRTDLFRVVFWDILLCKMIVDRRFRGAYCLHNQGFSAVDLADGKFVILHRCINCVSLECDGVWVSWSSESSEVYCRVVKQMSTSIWLHGSTSQKTLNFISPPWEPEISLGRICSDFKLGQGRGHNVLTEREEVQVNWSFAETRHLTNGDEYEGPFRCSQTMSSSVHVVTHRGDVRALSSHGSGSPLDCQKYWDAARWNRNEYARWLDYRLTRGSIDNCYDDT